MIDPERQKLSYTDEKAVRLVAEDKVHVKWIERFKRAAHGTVDGDSKETYMVSFSPAGRICTCMAGANHKDCSHGKALELAVKDGATPLQLEMML